MMTVFPVFAFKDNLIWLIRSGQCCAVVDPGLAAPVRAALTQEGLRLTDILITHHHADHTGGVEELRHHWPDATLWRDEDAAQFHICDGQIQVDNFATPGHTLDHRSYFIAGQADQPPLLFCGDTLFSGGCGRLFEGTPAQLFTSLQHLAQLPPQTLVYCAHEYTLSNLRFAQWVEPDNLDLALYQAWGEQQRAQDLPTLPSQIGREQKINPFLRTAHLTQWARAHQQASRPEPRDNELADEPMDELAVFTYLRTLKNHF